MQLYIVKFLDSTLPEEYDEPSVDLVAAKSSKSAKELILDYFAQLNDGYGPQIKKEDLIVEGPIDPNKYDDETILI